MGSARCETRQAGRLPYPEQTTALGNCFRTSANASNGQLIRFAASSAKAGHFLGAVIQAARGYRRVLMLLGANKAEAEEQVMELLRQEGLSRKKTKQLARI